MTRDTESGSASLPKSEIIGRKEGEEGGAEGVLNFVVEFLGTVDRGLIDAGLAARLGAEEITFLSPGLLVCFTSVSSRRKVNCTYIDLCAVEAILVHHPVNVRNRKARLVDLDCIRPHRLSAFANFPILTICRSVGSALSSFSSLYHK